MGKLTSRRGETLVESLCAILVITIVFVFLCGAIVSAARSNKQVRDYAGISFEYGNMTNTGERTIQVYDENSTALREEYTVTEYSTSQDANPDSNYRSYTYHRYTIQEAGK